MMKVVGGVRKSIDQSWLARGLGLGLGLVLLCWGYKGVQQDIPWEEASTLQIGSVVFLPRQCTSRQLHPSHRLFDQDGHQDIPQPPYCQDLAPCDFWLFPKLRGYRYVTIEEMKRLWRRSLTRSHKKTSMGPSRSCWNSTTSALQPEEVTSTGTRISCVLSIKVPIRKKSENLSYAPHICTWYPQRRKMKKYLHN